jgi:hypothetical protein
MSITVTLFLVFLTARSPAEWKQLAPGMDLCIVTSEKEFAWGDGRITVVRIDPTQWELVYAGADKTGEEPAKTARQ